MLFLPCKQFVSVIVYVFLGTALSLIDLMTTMQTAQLFENGEYMVIYVDMTYSEKETYKYLWSRPVLFHCLTNSINTNLILEFEVLDKFHTCYNHQADFENRGKSLFVVVPTAPKKEYEDFGDIVREYNSKAPFYFNTPKIFENINYEKFITLYAAYLYDSVRLYAKALDKLLKGYPELTDEIIELVASDGVTILNSIIEERNYTSK